MRTAQREEHIVETMYTTGSVLFSDLRIVVEDLCELPSIRKYVQNTDLFLLKDSVESVSFEYSSLLQAGSIRFVVHVIVYLSYVEWYVSVDALIVYDFELLRLMLDTNECIRFFQRQFSVVYHVYDVGFWFTPVSRSIAKDGELCHFVYFLLLKSREISSLPEIHE